MVAPMMMALVRPIALRRSPNGAVSTSVMTQMPP